MIAIATILALILIRINDGVPIKMEKMTISKTNIADLKSSATSYMYDQGQNYPVTYVHYTNYGNGRYYDTPLPVHYIVDSSGKGGIAPVALSVPQTATLHESPVISYANVGQKPSPYVQQRLSYVKTTGNDHMAAQGVYIVPQKPLAPYYVPLSNEKVVKVDDSNQGHTKEKSNKDVKEIDNEDEDYNDEHEDDDDDDDDDDNEDEDENDTGYYKDHKTYHSSIPLKGFKHSHLEHSQELYGKDHGDLDSSLRDSESSFNFKEHSSNGEKGDSARNSYDQFDEEQEKVYDSSKKAGRYDLKGGQKKEYINKSNVYGQHDDSIKGEEGAKSENNSYYKKGGKTNGFHKVYHKDEYKKNTEFYDESHKDGQFGKHFAFDQHNNAKEGDCNNKSHRDSGLDQWNKTKKDDFNKGHDVSHNQGKHLKNEEDSYHNDYSDYSKEDSERVKSNHGYSKTHDDH